MKALYTLVGMRFRGTEALVNSLPVGEPLTLVREPTNQHDPNAVQVWAREQHVAYVRGSEVAPLAAFIDRAGNQAMLSPGAPVVVGVTGKMAATEKPMVEVEEENGNV